MVGVVATVSADAAVQIRAGTDDDVAPVLALWRVAAEDAYRPPDRPAALVRVIARDPAALMLAVVDGDIVGTLIAGWDGWRFHLYRLAVHPEHRRRGVAQMLISAAEARFAASGASRVDAMVLDGNAAAHGFWRAQGYLPQSEWSRWVKPLG